MIDGVAIKGLPIIADERGHLMEILRSDDDVFEKFGQAQLMTTFPGAVEAWHLHKGQDDNIACVRGMVKLVIYDDRGGSSTRAELMEVFLGEHRPVLVHVPKGLHHGWKCISEHEAYVIDFATELLDHKRPDNYRLQADTDAIPYDWAIKMG